MFHLSSPQINQIKYNKIPKSALNLTLMNFATNLPEQPTMKDSKFRETLQENLKFFKSLVYLTKKIFML